MTPHCVPWPQMFVQWMGKTGPSKIHLAYHHGTDCGTRITDATGGWYGIAYMSQPVGDLCRRCFR